VSFNNIESIFLTFPEGTAESFDILANKKFEKDFKRYNQIFQTQITKKEKRENNLNEDDKKQDYFLRKLQMILNLTNEIGEPNDRKKSKNDKENKAKGNKENQITPKKDKIKNKKVNEDDDEDEEEEEEENENEEQQNNENIPKKTLFEIADNYVFTDDNYFKLVLILLRIRARIPVIMMGETGCGKTSLIRKLSELIHNGDKKKNENIKYSCWNKR
jgi:ATP-dependent Clp protease ATP-binding subunit ClpA